MVIEFIHTNFQPVQLAIDHEQVIHLSRLLLDIDGCPLVLFAVFRYILWLEEAVGLYELWLSNVFELEV